MRSKQNKKSPSFKLKRRDLLAGLAVTSLVPWTKKAHAHDELYIYNWDEYMSDDVLSRFGEMFNIEVIQNYFASSEENFAKLRTGYSGYDISFPSNDFVERLWRNELIKPLDHSQIPNLVNLAPIHQNPAYDPNNLHSVPYMWGTLGIAYRKSAVERPTSWQDVFTSTGLKNSGRTAWLSEASSIYAVAAQMLGLDPNDYSSTNQDKVFEVLMEAVPEVAVFSQDKGQDLLASGEVDVAIEWNGDISTLMDEDDDIDFVIPNEGTLYFVDCMVIPDDAHELELCHAFMNYILDPEVNKELAEYIGYATPNAAALKLASAEYRDNPVIFPPEGTVLFVPTYPGEEGLNLLYQNWEKLQTS